MSLFLKDSWLRCGGKLSECGNQCVSSVKGIAEEMQALRNSAVVWDYSWAFKFSLDAPDGADALDGLLAGDVLKLRYGRATDTFLAAESGKIASAVTVVDVDDKLFVFAEAPSAEAVSPIADLPGAQNLDGTHTVLSVDGPEAWRVLKAVFGADIYNLTYMSAEKYDFNGFPAIVVRAGKTGEFGYSVLVPNEAANALFDEFKRLSESLGGGLAGRDCLLTARAKGNFFNIFACGTEANNPIELGLQWQIDFSKERFVGRDAILAVRRNPLRKLVGVVCSCAAKRGGSLFDGGEQIGRIVNVDACDPNFALAFVEAKSAYPGVVFSMEGGSATVVSRPAVVTESLLRGME